MLVFVTVFNSTSVYRLEPAEVESLMGLNYKKDKLLALSQITDADQQSGWLWLRVNYCHEQASSTGPWYISKFKSAVLW